MRYYITILFLSIGLAGFSQERFTITFGTGVGQYKMEELKNFQELKEYWSGNILGTVDNFPAYFFYSGEAMVRINKLFSIGLVYRLQSTGCKSAYSDYSGVWRIEQKLKSDNAGILVDFPLLTKNKFAVAFQGRVYYAWTTFEYNEKQQLYDYPQEVAYKTIHRDKSVMLSPDLSFSYNILKHISLNLTTGYCFDTKGQLENVTTLFPGVSWVPTTSEYDWSGLRIGLSASYKF